MSNNKSQQESPRKHLLGIVVLSIVLALVLIFLLKDKKPEYQNTLSSNDSTFSEISSEQTEKIISTVAKQVEVSKKEIPIVLNILDAQKMAAKHNFFNLAEDGDIALFYKDNYVILYRPSEERVIQVTERK